MKGWVLVGALCGLFAIVFYAIWAWCKKMQPVLNQALHIFLGVTGLIASIRLIGFTVFEDLSVLVAAQNERGIWALTADDAIFIFIGAIAMGWVSIQSAYQGFSSLRVESRQEI